MFKEEEIINFADKLLIGLTKEEAKTILDEFALIDENINQINKLDLKEVEPAFMPFDLYVAHLREDIPEESVKVEELLANAKDTMENQIKVPRIVGGESNE